MAVATSSRKKRQTAAKKRKVSARAAAESKAYLNGNHYSKLSGMYLTSLDYTKAVSEWNAIPYLQTMYGAELCGYSMDPGDVPGSETFVRKDDTLPSGGGIWFPIYEQKEYALDGSQESLTKAISAIIPDLKWLSGETLDLHISAGEASLRPNESIDVQLRSGDSLKLVENGSGSYLKVSSGEFKISALLDGSSAISDWIDADDEQSISVCGLQVVPKTTLTQREIEYKTLAGEMSMVDSAVLTGTNVSSNVKISEYMMDMACGNFSAIKRQPTLARSPIKTPYLMRAPTKEIETYYSMACMTDLPNNYFVDAFKTANEIWTVLTGSSPYKDVGVPCGPIEKYETTLCPLSSGWYKFKVESDDYTLIAIDDKPVAIDSYDSYDDKMQMIDYLYKKNESISPELRRFDSDQLHALSSYISLFDKRYYAPRSLSASTINGISADMLNGRYNVGAAPGFYNEMTENISLSGYYYSHFKIEGSGTNGLNMPLSAMSNPYSDGCYFYLLKDNKYKFSLWHNDYYNSEYFIKTRKQVSGFNSLNVCIHYHLDSRISALMGTEEEQQYDLSIHGSVTSDTDAAAYWSKNDDLYPTTLDVKNAGLSVNNGLYSNKMDTPELSAWRDKGYALCQSGNAYLICANTNPCIQIFCIGDTLTDSEINRLSSNTYSNMIYKHIYNNSTIKTSMVVNLQQYLLKGPVKWQ